MVAYIPSAEDRLGFTLCNIKPSKYWTLEKCRNEALKYKTRSEFLKKSKEAYYRAMKNKWLDMVCGHMNTKSRKFFGYWNKELCSEEAKKYKTKQEFKLKSNGAYDASKRNGWLDEITEHMIKLGNRYNKFIYGYFFDDGYATWV